MQSKLDSTVEIAKSMEHGRGDVFQDGEDDMQVTIDEQLPATDLNTIYRESFFSQGPHSNQISLLSIFTFQSSHSVIGSK